MSVCIGMVQQFVYKAHRATYPMHESTHLPHASGQNFYAYGTEGWVRGWNRAWNRNHTIILMCSAVGSTSNTPSTTTVPSGGGDSFSSTCVPLGMSTFAFAWIGSEKVHVLSELVHASLCLRMHTITSNLHTPVSTVRHVRHVSVSGQKRSCIVYTRVVYTIQGWEALAWTQ